MEEHDAIECVRKGDLQGLESLLERYYVKAARVAYLITQDAQSAEDVAQETFVQLTKRIRRYDPRRPFEPWFMRCVCNAAIKAARRQARQVSLDGDTPERGSAALADLLVDPHPGVEQQVDDVLSQERIWAAIRVLPPRQRAVVVQRYYLGMKEAEMSTVLDCPPGTVKWLLNAARRNLRARLQ
jgi:RNA polymerase sigma-70 factor (ECF subfamily)